MKAAIYSGNKTFRIGQSERKEPGPGEVRLDVAYCGVCGSDMHVFHGHMDQRVKPPMVIGHEVSAVIGSVGAGVEGFSVEGARVSRASTITGWESESVTGLVSATRDYLGLLDPEDLRENGLDARFTDDEVACGILLGTRDVGAPVSQVTLSLGEVGYVQQVAMLSHSTLEDVVALLSTRELASDVSSAAQDGSRNVPK